MRKSAARAPVLELSGGSPGAANAQPVWASVASPGRVRCQVGCTTLTPIACSRPCVYVFGGGAFNYTVL